MKLMVELSYDTPILKGSSLWTIQIVAQSIEKGNI
jgi:hypothetical protein